MKKKQIAVFQIISVLAICIFVVLTVLYQKGYYDFTFIDRPSNNSDSRMTTKKNVLDLFTPTFGFGDDSQGQSGHAPITTVTTENVEDNVPDEMTTGVELGGETENNESSTLPPLDFEPETTEGGSETTDTSPESTDETSSDSTGDSTDESTGDAPESTGDPSESTDAHEETTGEPENTDEPESTDTPESTTGPDETEDVPEGSETTGDFEQTTGVDSSTEAENTP